jgi:tetratricopeptide (TPR) repeat protein
MSENLTSELSSKGYWPAVAMEYLNEKKYSKAVELCMLRLKEYPEILSGYVILARALFHSGQYETAEEEFYNILRKDPNNAAALKYLGDLKFRSGDEVTAFSYYDKVLEFDPYSGALVSPIKKEKTEETKVLTIKKGRENVNVDDIDLREIPFKTETVGDLLSRQGHFRLALKVFQHLAGESQDPRVLEKLEKTKTALKDRERKRCIKSELKNFRRS